MKIKDLIEDLQQLPEDMEIAVADEYGQFVELKRPITRLFIKEGGCYKLLYETEKDKAEGKVVVFW